MRKILVLGGAEAQVPLIQAAKNEGYYVVLCDWTTSNPGIALADKHYQVSTLDLDAVLKVAAEECVNGVISNSEPAMINVAKIATELKLIGNSAESVDCLQSKNSFRNLQKKLGIFSPKSFECNSIEDFWMLCDTTNYPVVVKPSKSSGTRGTTVFKRFEKDLMEKAFLECAEFSTNNNVTVEEYVEMPSLDVIEGDVFIHGGRFWWDGIFTTKRSKDAPMIPMTYIFPAVLRDEELKKIQTTIERIFDGAGITHGEFNVELYFTKKREVFCIEINTRQGGKGLPEMIEKHCGVNMYKLLVTTAMGDDSYWNDIHNTTLKKKFVTRHLVFGHSEGVYDGLDITDDAKSYITNIKNTEKKGKELMPARNATDCLAWIDMAFGDRSNQLRISEAAETYIKPRIQ